MIAIVIPTYNERENCEQLFALITATLPSAWIIVVDDQSTDGTGALVRRIAGTNPHIALLERTGPRGFAQSYIDGFRTALDRGADIIVQMDADLSHSPNDIPRLLTALDSADCAIGSRYCQGGGTVGWPLNRKLISKLGNWYARRSTGIPLNDITAGFAAWNANILSSVIAKPITSDGYVFQIELKYRAWKQSARIVEVPIVFHERERGASKMSRRTIMEAVHRVHALSKTV